MSREIRKRWQLLEGAEEPDLQVRLLSSFTIERLVPYLGVGLADAGFTPRLEVGAYNQVLQECLDPGSETRNSNTDVLVVWSRLEQLWGGLPAPLNDTLDQYTAPLREVAEASAGAAQAVGARLVFVLPTLPARRPLGVGDHANPQGVAAAAAAAREAAREFLSGVPGALVADADEAVRALGADGALDPRLEHLADIPYTEEAFRLVAEQIVRSVGLTVRSAPKVLALDADGTLWAGEAADPASIQLDGPAAAATFEFQRVLLDVRRAGVVLALCSKNIEDDVRAALEMPGMPLSWDDFSATSVSWDSKAQALQTIADELNLGLDSFAFIDDNPAEIMEVSTKLPQVRTILLPADPTEWTTFDPLQRVLDRLPPTEDDLHRAGRYTAERQRKTASASLSDEEYRERLAPEVRIFEPTEAHLPRFAQLMQRTNQFRLNSARPDQTELSQLASDEEALLRLVEAWDSFGDYGVVGGAVVKHADGTACLSALAISCRALGRGIEEAFLADLAREARERWGAELVATLEETGRNEPAIRFFRSKGLTGAGEAGLLENLAWPPYVRERVLQ